MAKGPSGQALAISSQNKNSFENIPTFEINVMSSDKGKNQKQLGGKKKGKMNKKKQENSNPEKSKTPTAARKPPHYPCLICNEEHFKRDCPHRSKVAKLLKN